MTTDTQTPATPDTPGTRFNSPAQLEYERMLAVKARPRIQASEGRVVDIDMPISSMVAFMVKWPRRPPGFE
jgi:predicted protein tyrosine phosphatase